jgi:hypothetical protein
LLAGALSLVVFSRLLGGEGSAQLLGEEGGAELPAAYNDTTGRPVELLFQRRLLRDALRLPGTAPPRARATHGSRVANDAAAASASGSLAGIVNLVRSI